MRKRLTTSLVASLLIATNLYSNELSNITISSATKSEQSIEDVTSNVEVITSEEIEERHFTNIVDALNSISGINFTSSGGLGATSTIYLRGMETKRILILIDGIRVNDVSKASGEASIEHLMLNDIEKIEVIKGAQSGIWGADASAGVINVITKKTKKGFNASINTEAGSFNTYKYGTTLSYSENKYYMSGTYNKIKSDGFSVYSKYGTNIDNYEKDGYKNETINGKFGYKFDDNNKVDIFYENIDSYKELDSSTADKPTSFSDYEMSMGSVNYQNINRYTVSDFYFNHSDFNRVYYSGTSYSYYNGDVNEFGLKNRVNYIDKENFLIFGADSKNFNVNQPIDNSYKNYAFYLTNSNKFSNTVITQSIRYDNYNKFENKTTGKIGIKYSFDKDIYVSSNLSTGYNVPTIYQLFHPTNGNVNLKPETTKSADLNFAYKSLSISLYQNKIKDMIDWSGAYVNYDGESTIKGIELSYKKNITSYTLLNLSYDITDAKNNSDQNIRRIPRETFKASVDYYGVKDFHFNLNGQYIGERYNSDNNTGTQTGRYTVFNGLVNYDLNRNTKIYLKIDNILDKYYQEVSGYSTAPRSAYIGLNYKF